MPKKGDAVYIEGHFKEVGVFGTEQSTGVQCVQHVWVRPTRTRVNGIIIYVDYEDHEVRIRWTDHPYADPEEDKVTSMDFATLYGQWSSKKECYVVTEQDV